eukprot:824149-Pelagomonas_calceolata.AAC.2
MSSSHGDDKNGTSTNGLSWVVQLQQYMRDVQGQEGSASQQAGNRKVCASPCGEGAGGARAQVSVKATLHGCSTPQDKALAYTKDSSA